MKIINLYNIRVNKNFLLSSLSDKKIENAKKYINRYNRIDKPIVLNDGVLVDNYARYIAAYLMGIHEVPYVELQEMSYVVGKFAYSDKKYTWKNDRYIDVEVGDKVLVKVKYRNEKKLQVIEVVDIFKSDSFDLYNKHKSIVKKVSN